MTVVVQSLTSLALVVPSLLAPVAAADIGVDASRIGVLVAWSYFCAIVAGVVAGPLVVRYGPARVFQFSVALVTAGLLLGFGGSLVLALALGAMSGAAHGLVNPASSTILIRAAPPRLRSLIFSLKQTGVPLGSAMAGVLLPAMLLVMHWQAAVLVLGIASAPLLALVQPFRRLYDAERSTDHPIGFSGIRMPVLEMIAHRPIFELALSSAVFSAVQLCLVTYLVLLLKVGLGYTLVAAGLVYSASQAAGVAGRIVWGALADRLQAPREVLSGLGLTMGLCGLAAAFFSPQWPIAAVVAVSALYGASAVGWNGIYLAEVARLAPEGKVGLLTAGTQVLTFGGAMLGPPVFALIVAATGSYSQGYLLFAVLPLVSALRIFATRARGRAGKPR